MYLGIIWMDTDYTLLVTEVTTRLEHDKRIQVGKKWDVIKLKKK